MPTLSVGRTDRRLRRGVTLVEMMIVVTLVALMAGITFPSVSSGVDSLRLRGAAEEIAAVFNAAVLRAERRQQAVEIAILPLENAIAVTSMDPGFLRRYELPSGIALAQVLPAVPLPDAAPRRFLVYPGGTVPRIALVLANPSGARRMVRVDPITGVTEQRTLDPGERIP